MPYPSPNHGGGPRAPVRTQPCRYFAAGKCFKGSKCHFSHELASPSSRQDAVVSPASSMNGAANGGACGKCAEYQEEVTALKWQVESAKEKAREVDRAHVEITQLRREVELAKGAPCNKCVAANAKMDALRRQVEAAKAHLAEMARQAALAQRTLDAVEAALGDSRAGSPAAGGMMNGGMTNGGMANGEMTNGGTAHAGERPIVANPWGGGSARALLGAGVADSPPNGSDNSPAREVLRDFPWDKDSDSGAFHDAHQSLGGEGSIRSGGMSPSPPNPRDVLVSFYRSHNPDVDMSDPSRLNAIDEMLFRHAGREEELFLKLAQKYEVDPSVFGLRADGNDVREVPSPNAVRQSGRLSPEAKPFSPAGARATAAPTLESVLASCASYLTGSPVQYAAWLREEMDIGTLSDLAEALESCPSDLLEGDGTAGIKPTFFRTFEKAALDAAKGSREASPVALDDASPQDKPIFSTFGAATAPVAAAKEKSEEGWSCPACTFINPKLYVSCSVCGSDSPEVSAEREREKKQKENALKAEKLAAEKAVVDEKKRRKQAEKQRKKEAKLAEQARKEAEERAEEEENRQLRLKAKQEKRALMDQEAQKQKTAQKTRAPAATKQSAKATSSSASTASAVSKSNGNKGGAATAPKRPRSPMIIAKDQKATTFNMSRLSSFICSSSGSKQGVHPAFGLLRNESTRQLGRTLLHLEDSIRVCKSELAGLIKQRDGGHPAEEMVEKSEKRLLEKKELRASIAKSYKMTVDNIESAERTWASTLGDRNRRMSKAFGDKEDSIRNELNDALSTLVKADKRIQDNSKIVAGMETELETIKAKIKAKEEEIEGVQDEVNQMELDIAKKSKGKSDPSEESGLVKTIAKAAQKATELIVGDDKARVIKRDDKKRALRKELLKLKKNERKKESEIEYEKNFPELWPLEKERVENSIPHLRKMLLRVADEEEAEKERLAAENGEKTGKFAARRANAERSSSSAVELVTEQIDEETKRLEECKRMVKAGKHGLEPMIERKTRELEKLRLEISDGKKTGQQEDPDFSIDNTRDERGHTFLMMASQNNDIRTVRVCLKIGARPTVMNDEGLTAIDYAFRFDFEEVTDLILQSGGSLPRKQIGAFSCLEDMTAVNVEASKDWDDALVVAQNAALPAESLMESPETCENDPNKRMEVLTDKEQMMDFSCFEARMTENEIDSDHVRRVVLLDSQVHNWCLTTQSEDFRALSNFVQCLEGLKPSSLRRPNVQPTKVQRRAIVGTTHTFELLGAEFECESGRKVVLFSPFVSGEAEGQTQIGILVWAIAESNEASLFKTLVSNSEFIRAKHELDDRFLSHKDDVLELGRDMHLLDLHSTSIWTTSTMDLYIVNVDQGDLLRILEPSFSAKKRIVYSEELVNRAIFRTTEEEAAESEGILAAERQDMSSQILGGAGTGKTLLLIKKVVDEDPSKKILVVTRLPRLINVIKTAVEEKRKDGLENLSMSTYDELMQLLSQRVTPDDEEDYTSFVQFDRVRFDCDSDAGVSFSQQFVRVHLNENERKAMSVAQIEPLTLWYAIITLKSSSKCVETKAPLMLDEYLFLPKTFGLTEQQRVLCYELFEKYEEWRQSNGIWDEMDRSLYVLAHGPSTFRDRSFVPWTRRVQMGEPGLLDDHDNPLFPFCFDIVAADEAQDFTEVDLALFARMSSSIRSLFLSADPAQSVELGIKMREGTVNDVMHRLISDDRTHVKDVLQKIELRTNHRTHAENLEMGKCIRRILARSFQVPDAKERALIKGKLPQMLRIGSVSQLADPKVFRGGNVVFLAPDELVSELRTTFRESGITNDVFGVREAKGLEFDACALLGFFGFMEESSEQWQNVLRWLSSPSKITITSSAEKVGGVTLVDCDYSLTHPEIADQAMMLYTALTRARNQLYLVEPNSKSARKKVNLADFAFRRFADLKLAKQVHAIDEGQSEMSPAQHKARGVLLVTQALDMSRGHESLSAPAKGNDKELYDKCEKHLNAVLTKHRLVRFVKETFYTHGRYNLENRFIEVLQFEQMVGEFFSECLCDPFMVEEVAEVRKLVEEAFFGTPYEIRLKQICRTVEELNGK